MNIFEMYFVVMLCCEKRGTKMYTEDNIYVLMA